MRFDKLSHQVIKCALEVHNHLGPGLPESTYEQCLAYEVSRRRIPFKLQVPIPVQYKEIKLDCGYRLDVLVDDTLVVEIKSIQKILPIHQAQLLTYLKLAGIRTGLLINFNVKLLKSGIKRMVL